MATPHCIKHDRPLQLLGAIPMCPECLAAQSTTAVTEVARLDRMLEADQLKKGVLNTGIPERFVSSSFENFSAEGSRAARLRDLLTQYAAEFEVQRDLRTGFLFLGLQGRGKTHLACAIANALAIRGYTVRYASLPALTSRVRRTYKPDSPETVSDITGDLIDADFLILDEIDLHGTSDTDYQMLYDVINGRYDRTGHPTLAISNRSQAQLEADLNERLVSRILSGSPAIQFDWESYRDTLPARLRAAQLAAR